MPVTDHLAWSEIRDFRPGLWTASPHLMPATAGQQMDNCYPQPSGGLRAFFRTNDAGLTPTGIPTTKVVRGFDIGYVVQQPASMTTLTSNAMAVVSDAAAPSQGFELYELDRSVSTGAGWVLRKAFAAGTAGSDLHFPSFFAGHYNATQGDLMVFTINQPTAVTADEGTWWARWQQAGVVTQISQDTGLVVSHQARVIQALGNTVRWTAPDGLTFTDTLTMQARGQAGARISWMLPVAPSDLFIGMLGGQLWNIQGDLGGGYAVREMGRFQSNAFVQKPSFSPYGIILIAQTDGVYLLSPGGGATHISKQLDPTTWAPDPIDALSVGQVVFYREFSYFPRGYVFDHSTQSWFRVPALADCMYFALDGTMGQEKIVGATSTAPAAFPSVSFAGGGSRARDFTWKSAPIRDPSGRGIQIREVQLVVQSYGTDETITVTIGGFSRVFRITQTGRLAPRFLFKEEAPELDVTIRSESVAAAEAPTIEVVRIGTRPGHLLTTGATLEALNTTRWDAADALWDSGKVWA